MLNLHHYQKLSRSLNPSLKMRVRLVAPFYIERIRHLHDPRSLYAAAVTALKPYFSQATPDQLDVVVAYLLGFVASGEGDAVGKPSSFNRHTKLHSAHPLRTMNSWSDMDILSNLLKKTSEVEAGINQNIK